MLQGATIRRDEATGAVIVARIMRGGAADRSGNLCLLFLCRSELSVAVVHDMRAGTQAREVTLGGQAIITRVGNKEDTILYNNLDFSFLKPPNIHIVDIFLVARS